MYDEAQVPSCVKKTRLNPESALAYIAAGVDRSAAAPLPARALGKMRGRRRLSCRSPRKPTTYWDEAFLEEGDIPGGDPRTGGPARRYAPSSPKVHFNLARAYAQSRGAPPEAEKERAEFERLNALLPGPAKKSLRRPACRE